MHLFLNSRQSWNHINIETTTTKYRNVAATIAISNNVNKLYLKEKAEIKTTVNRKTLNQKIIDDNVNKLYLKEKAGIKTTVNRKTLNQKIIDDGQVKGISFLITMQ